MKKLLLTAAVMLTTVVGAWAQTDIEKNVYYRIKNLGRTQYMSTNGTQVTSVAEDASSLNQYWKFVAGENANAGKYALATPGGKYVNYKTTDNTVWELSETPVYFTVAKTNDYYTIAYDPTQDHGFAHANASGSVVRWGSGADASHWTLVKSEYTDASFVKVVYTYKYNAEAKATQTETRFNEAAYPSQTVVLPYGFAVSNAPTGNIPSEYNGGTCSVDLTIVKEKELPFVAATDIASIDHWYYMNIRDDNTRTYLKYETGVNYIKAADNKSAVEAASNKGAYIWGFVGTDPFEGYKIVNLMTGESYILSSPNAPTANANAAQLARMVKADAVTGNANWFMTNATHDNASEGVFYIQHPTASAYAFNRQTYSGGNSLCYWTGRDVGSGICLEEVTVNNDILKGILSARISEANTVKTSASANQGHPGFYTSASVSALSDAITAAQAVLDNASATAEEIKNASASLPVAAEGLQIALPEAGKFYRIKNNAGTWHMVSGEEKASDNYVQFVADAATTKSSVFYFDGRHLVSYDNGMYIVAGPFFGGTNKNDFLGYTNTVDDTRKANVGFRASATFGKLNVVFSSNRYLHNNGTSHNGNAGGSDADENYRFTVEEVTSLPVDMSAGWATLYSPVQLACGSDVEAYTVDAVAAGATSANLTSVGTSIPAATGVILKAKESVTGTVNLDIEGNTLAAATTALEGTYPAANISADAYVLASKNDAVGLYKVENNGSWKNNGFKAYLPAPAAGAPALTFSFGDDTDAIKGTEAVKNNGAIYDLSGRRVKAAGKGIFIINGKKVIK